MQNTIHVTTSLKTNGPKIRENLRTANFNAKFTGYKNSVIDMEMCTGT